MQHQEPGSCRAFDPNNLNETFRHFSMVVRGEVTRIRLQSRSARNPNSVLLTGSTRTKIEHYISRIRDMVEKSDLESDRKKRLQNRLDQLVDELSRPRLSFAKTMGILAAALATTASSITIAADGQSAVAHIIQLIGHDKETEDAAAQRLTPPPKALPAQPGAWRHIGGCHAWRRQNAAQGPVRWRHSVRYLGPVGRLPRLPALAVHVLQLGPVMLAGQGFGMAAIGTGLAAFNLGGIAGAVGSTWLTYRFGSRPTIIGMCAVAIIGAVFLGFFPVKATDSLWPLLILFFIESFGIGGFQNVLYPLAAHIYPPISKATGVGAASSAGRIGAVASAFTGLLSIQWRGASGYFLVLAAVMAVGLLCAMMIRNNLRPRASEITGKTSFDQA